jgi:glycosyltransferase involved in cell wall biosynthesis
MRIGLISSGTSLDRIPPIYGGGIQKYLWSLARALNNLGHEIHIFTNQQPQQLTEEILDDIHIHRISQVLKAKPLATFVFGLNTAVKILKIQKEIGRFQILHAQSRVSGLIIRYFLHHITFVFTAHNWDVALTRPGELISPLSHAVLFLIEKLVYWQSNKIISLTSFFQRVLSTRYHVPKPKIQIIPNMINGPEDSENPLLMHPTIKKLISKPFLLFVGRLEKEKGCEFLLNSFEDIINQNKTLNLIIVGTGSLKSTLKKMAAALPFKNSIYILGTLHEIQLKFLLSAARLLLLPSQFEIMPTIILEAWTAKCPVIVNAYQGVETLIRDRKTGLVFQRNNELQLSTLIKELLINKNMRQEIIQNSLTQLQTKYTSSVVVQQIFALYSKLLKRCTQ